MTIGLALATWRPFLTEPLVLIAADSRVSSHSQLVTDAGVKTYDVGQRLGMVSCGSALPPITAAEIVRPIFDAHNRARTGTPLSFFDSVRTLAFFIDRVASESNMTGESVAVGFFRSGAPGLARIRITNADRHVTFVRPARGGFVAIPLGLPLATDVVLRGMIRAHEAGRSIISAALGLIHYMAGHQGDPFASIGGGLSIGACTRDQAAFEWPPIEIAGRRYVRGMDITDVSREAWPTGLCAEYDEAWCAAVEQDATEKPFGEALIVPGNEVHSLRYDLRDFVANDEAFKTHDDPAGF
jgi:hypothetical protein